MKKGFTLIELLAVIVILAIIALIATPIVLNIISDTKKNASLRSAEFYMDAVEYAIANTVLNGDPIENGTYSILENGNICLEYDTDSKCSRELEIEMNGEKPKNGEITITSGNVSEIGLLYGDKTIVKNDKDELVYQEDSKTIKPDVCEYKDSEVVCGTESFYIIEQTDKTVTMLAKYNLNVGDTKYPNESTYGKQDENVVFTQVTWNGYMGYGGVAFSTEVYWNETEVGTFVYNEKSNVYQYVNSYKEYLESIDVSVIDATLMSFEQFEKVRECTFYDANSDGIIDSSATSSDVAMGCSGTRITNQYFWLGTANSATKVWGFFGGDQFMGINHDNVFYSGVRPLITIDKVQVKNLD